MESCCAESFPIGDNRVRNFLQPSENPCFLQPSSTSQKGPESRVHAALGRCSLPVAAIAWRIDISGSSGINFQRPYSSRDVVDHRHIRDVRGPHRNPPIPSKNTGEKK